LPAEVRHEGARAFVNWVGCAAGGSREPDVELMVGMLSEFSGEKNATVVGRRERLDAPNAAFINCMSSAALAFNDTHNRTVAHPTSPVAAALIALAERQPVSGRDLLHALILGIELQCRVGNILCTPPAECAVGLSTQGLLGGIGAAVAVAKVLGLDETGIATAIGLAANQAAGIRESQSTMGSHLIPGQAARSGFLAALLAARGFECTDTMIEGPKGYAVSFSSRPNFDAALEGLGQAFEITTLAYKPYPSGVVIHPIIDACLEIAQGKPLPAAQIERIELTVNPLAVKLTNLVAPKDCGQGLVSMQHWAAATLTQGAAGIAQVADAVVRDPVISELRRRVTYTAVENMRYEAAAVRVVMKDGRSLRAEVKDCRGSVGRPLSDEDITRKARGQLQTVFPEDVAARILDQSWRIAECTGVAAFCKDLTTV
jgi:2-methylcitrate dehydratase PrpD